ncbi:Crp/Fnr family transcriptional regulator [Sphingosinicella sp. YJ22]|uniref:Crp/Fnr family transcriptional regulator n=1 Tax=Sphingosinicella sp. YJ22 TaxID=1104780 RepID=UPI001408830B|nr:Crp/Fnr family transcriptional regulator [Sphingosinicella sp. YJ22]
MPANDNEPAAGLIRKLRRLAPLDPDDRQLLAALPYRPEAVPAGRVLVSEGSIVAQCCLLVDGYACRHKTSADGKRQIVSFHVAGDLLDVQHLMLERADHDVETVTAADIAWVPADRLRALALDRPNIGQALWRDALIDASVFREWVLNVGRRDARTRIAHMLSELAARVLAAGAASEDHLLLPLTQEQIADATGLTAVHVNRMLRQLREAGALSVVARGVCIEDFGRLRAISSFDPAYLHAAA